MLVEGLQERKIPYSVVNLSGNDTLPNAPPSLLRFAEYIKILLDYFYKTAFGKKTVYLSIARSRPGFFRDMVMIWFASMNRHRMICHVKGGNYDQFYAKQPDWLQFLIRKTLLKVNSILVLGESLRKMFDFEPKLQEKIHVVPNGLPSKDYIECTPKSLPEDINQPIRILYLSNLIESKGYFDVLEAVKILVKEYGLFVECNFCGKFLTNPSDDLRVLSSQQAKDMFEAFVKTNKLEKNIKYLGLVYGKAKVEILKTSHFFVLPTNYSTEGQPVSIIEAMAYGNVVISTNYRAISDMVIDGKTGYFVPYGCPVEIAENIYKLVKNPSKYTEISASAITHFKKFFTRDAHLNKLISFLINN
ncbi:MAG: glycosyltransferase family 4 protein [Nitrososphaeria archaeon]